MHAPKRNKRETPPVDLSDPLRATLVRHGFEAAARSLGWVPDRTACIAAWHDFPRCLAHYPTRLSRPGAWWMGRQKG
jgi:hypothetical protein